MIRGALKAVFFTGLVLITAEGLLHLKDQLQLTPNQRAYEALERIVHGRIYDLWMRPAGPSPFEPPLLVYSNRDSDDPERLRHVFETTRLSPSRTWKTYDFLQEERLREETAYVVHSNSLGFRGAERSRAKAKNVTRIIALGTYEAFGHAVNEADTFEAHLEAILNAKPEGRRFEVWNGGRHAGTAIVGLARMTYEILAYHPDLLILDYGFVDPYVWDDNLIPGALHFPTTPVGRVFRKLARPFAAAFSRTRLWSELSHRYVGDTFPEHMKNFEIVMAKMVAIAKREGIPVILVRPYATEPLVGEILQKMAGSRVGYVDVQEEFRQHLPTQEEYARYDSSKTWMREYSLPVSFDPGHPFYPFKSDLLQINGRGHRVLAEALAIQVRKLLP